MKVPNRPPPLAQLFKTLSPERLIHSQMAVQGPMVDGKYLHWDELRHRRPPGDLTLQEWWFGLKMQRTPAKAIPLVGVDGQPFTYRLPESIQESLHQIDLEAGGSVEAMEPVLEPITNPETRKRYLVRSLDGGSDHVQPAGGGGHDTRGRQGDDPRGPPAEEPGRADDPE